MCRKRAVARTAKPSHPMKPVGSIVMDQGDGVTGFLAPAVESSVADPAEEQPRRAWGCLEGKFPAGLHGTVYVATTVTVQNVGWPPARVEIKKDHGKTMAFTGMKPFSPTR